MTHNEAKHFLLQMGNMQSPEQRKFSAQIGEAFGIFLHSMPTQEEFSQYLSGVIITPSMLYHLWNK